MSVISYWVKAIGFYLSVDTRALTAVAADAHIALCKGQGMERNGAFPLAFDIGLGIGNIL